MFLAAVLIISAVRLSSRMSNAGIVAQRGPEQQPCKRVETLSADAWREEYAAAMRLRDGVGRR
jgi:hypothetical protein